MIELSYFLYGFTYVLSGLAMLYVAKTAFDFATPYKLNVQLTERDNPAIGVVLSGFLLGIISVLVGSFFGEGEGVIGFDGYLTDMGPTAFYGLIGIILLLVAGVINDKCILRNFSNNTEILEKQNVSVGVVIGAGYIGSGLIIAGGLQGSEDILSVPLAFIFGQLALVIFAVVYQKATAYDDQNELSTQQNLACGIAFGGNILAYSILLMKGLSMGDGELIELKDRLFHFSYYAVSGAVALPVLRLINDKLFLPNASLTDEIVKDKNTNASLIEATLAIAISILLIINL